MHRRKPCPLSTVQHMRDEPRTVWSAPYPCNDVCETFIPLALRKLTTEFFFFISKPRKPYLESFRQAHTSNGYVRFSRFHKMLL